MLWYRLLQLRRGSTAQLARVAQGINRSGNERARSRAIEVLIGRLLDRLSVEIRALPDAEELRIVEALTVLSADWPRSSAATSMVPRLLEQLGGPGKKYPLIGLLGRLQDERAIRPLLLLTGDTAHSAKDALVMLGPTRVIAHIIDLMKTGSAMSIEVTRHLDAMLRHLDLESRARVAPQITTPLVEAALRFEPWLLQILDTLALVEPAWASSSSGLALAPKILALSAAKAVTVDDLLKRPDALVAVGRYDFPATERLLWGAVSGSDYKRGNEAYWRAMRTLWAAGLLTHLASVLDALRSENGQRYELIPTGRKYEYTGKGTRRFVMRFREELFPSLLKHVRTLSEETLRAFALLEDVQVSEENTDCLSRWWDTEKLDSAPLRQAARQELIRRGLSA